MALIAFEQNRPISRLEVAGGLVAAGVAGAMIMRGFFHSPFSDNGTYIFPTDNPPAFEAALDIYQDNGVDPILDVSSGGVIRALMADKGIVNLSPRNLADEIGPAGGTKIFRANRPREAAERAIDILAEHGFEDGRIVDVMKHENKPDMMLLLRSKAFQYGVFGFRVSPLKLGGYKKPPKWDPFRVHTI